MLEWLEASRPVKIRHMEYEFALDNPKIFCSFVESRI
jgi:hypothetical protein